MIGFLLGLVQCVMVTLVAVTLFWVVCGPIVEKVLEILSD